MLVLVVSLKVKPGRADDFIVAAQADGEGTTENEDGNFQFSVARDQADPDRFSCSRSIGTKLRWRRTARRLTSCATAS